MVIYLHPNIQSVAIATVGAIPQCTGRVIMTCRYQDYRWLVERIFECQILYWVRQKEKQRKKRHPVKHLSGQQYLCLCVGFQHQYQLQLLRIEHLSAILIKSAMQASTTLFKIITEHCNDNTDFDQILKTSRKSSKLLTRFTFSSCKGQVYQTLVIGTSHRLKTIPPPQAIFLPGKRHNYFLAMELHIQRKKSFLVQ